MEKPASSYSKVPLPATNLLHEFLKVYWLRPESALFLAVSAHVLRRAPWLPVEKPSLDLGAGNGLFSFIAAGGTLEWDYDVYRRSGDVDGFRRNEDIYDHASGISPRPSSAPEFNYTFGLDHKANLMKQAEGLGMYGDHKIGNANKTWPFEPGSLRTVFSNIGYWLADPRFVFNELSRVLARGGRAFLALQDPSLPGLCPSYRAEEFGEYSALMEQLNHGRSACSLWRLGLEELEDLGQTAGFRLIHHRRYLSELVLKVWDIGLRPLSPVLITMANGLPEEKRAACKRKWVETLDRLLGPVFESEKDKTEPAGYLYLIFEKA